MVYLPPFSPGFFAQRFAAAAFPIFESSAYGFSPDEHYLRHQPKSKRKTSSHFVFPFR
jgi:hypothetical protein